MIIQSTSVVKTPCAGRDLLRANQSWLQGRSPETRFHFRGHWDYIWNRWAIIFPESGQRSIQHYRVRAVPDSPRRSGALGALLHVSIALSNARLDFANQGRLSTPPYSSGSWTRSSSQWSTTSLYWPGNQVSISRVYKCGPTAEP